MSRVSCPLPSTTLAVGGTAGNDDWRDGLKEKVGGGVEEGRGEGGGGGRKREGRGGGGGRGEGGTETMGLT